MFDTFIYYNFSHPDYIVNSSINEFKCKYNNSHFIVSNKKEYKYFISNEMYDINILHFINTGKVLIENTNGVVNNGYITPYVIHQKNFINEVIQVKETLSKYYSSIDYSYEYYNKISTVLYEIEKNGLCVDKPLFEKETKQIIDNNLIYSNYNIFNITGRPSNTYNKLNFMAIPKNTSLRKSFISRYDNGRLLLMDYIGYHPSIISSLINYNIPNNETIYEHLAKKYFKKEEVNSEDITHIKKVAMYYFYGDTLRDSTQIEYFELVEELKNKYWELYKKNGYIETKLYKRKLSKNLLGDISRGRLFAYLIQAMETEYNIQVINECVEYCKYTFIIPILYIYDSILFDISKDISNNQIKGLKNILEGNHFKVRTYIGNNYGDLLLEKSL